MTVQQKNSFQIWALIDQAVSFFSNSLLVGWVGPKRLEVGLVLRAKCIDQEKSPAIFMEVSWRMRYTFAHKLEHKTAMGGEGISRFGLKLSQISPIFELVMKELKSYNIQLQQVAPSYRSLL